MGNVVEMFCVVCPWVGGPYKIGTGWKHCNGLFKCSGCGVITNCCDRIFDEQSSSRKMYSWFDERDKIIITHVACHCEKCGSLLRSSLPGPSSLLKARGETIFDTDDRFSVKSSCPLCKNYTLKLLNVGLWG